MMDTVATLNLVFTIIVCAIGIWGYLKTKKDVPLYIGIAYGIFSVSHLLAVVGLSASLNILLIIIRLVAYLLMILSVYKLAIKK